MEDIASRLTHLSRPRLLSRAAKNGVRTYSRSRDLKRLLGSNAPGSTAAIVLKLMDREQEIEWKRRTAEPGYSLIRHVDVLIAIAAEGQSVTAATKTECSAGHTKKRGSLSGIRA